MDAETQNSSYKNGTSAWVTSDGDFFGQPKVVVTFVLCYMVAIWTVVMHGLIIVCFVTNRRQPWVHKSLGILCLVWTDFCSGLGYFWLVFTQTRTEVSYIACVMPLGNYMATQLATGLHILRLCVYRLLAVISRRQMGSERARNVLLQFVSIYIIALLINVIPMVWVKEKTVYNACNLQYLVEDKLATTCIFMLSVLSLPTIVTTIIYTVIIYTLKRNNAIVCPDKADVGCNNTPSKPGDPANQRSTIAGQHTRDPGQNTASRTTESKSLFSSSYQTPQLLVQYKNKAVFTIGIILLLNNLALLPYFATLTYQSIHPHSVAPIYAWFGSSVALQLNSAVSPIVYCLRVKIIKESFYKMILCK